VTETGIVEVNYQAKINETLTNLLQIGMTTGDPPRLDRMSFSGKGP
jgi:hypothetical protein